MYVRVVTPFAPASDLQIEDEMVAIFDGLCAKWCDLFEKIVVWDFRETYKVDGAQSTADWLAYRFAVADTTAREWVRMAKALDFLPAIACAFREGLLSYDKVRELTRFVTFAEDVDLAKEAIGMSAEEVRRLAAVRVRLTRELADARYQHRYLRARRDSANGFVNIWARLPDAEGEVVLKAIDRRSTAADPETPFQQRRADALVEVCSMALGADADPDRATVVVHTDIDTFVSGAGNAMLEGGTAIAPQTLDRLTCDGRLQTVIHSGGEIAAGKVTAVVPHYLRRQLRARDGRCIFPGCSNAIWVHAHHLEHRVALGRTELSNLVLLCGFHHRLVHEGGWGLHLTAEGDRVFVRPDGRPLYSHVDPAKRPAAKARAP